MNKKVDASMAIAQEANAAAAKRGPSREMRAGFWEGWAPYNPRGDLRGFARAARRLSVRLLVPCPSYSPRRTSAATATKECTVATARGCSEGSTATAAALPFESTASSLLFQLQATPPRRFRQWPLHDSQSRYPPTIGVLS